jgi:hypothetical protein
MDVNKITIKKTGTCIRSPKYSTVLLLKRSALLVNLHSNYVTLLWCVFPAVYCIHTCIINLMETLMKTISINKSQFPTFYYFSCIFIYADKRSYPCLKLHRVLVEIH